MWYNNYAKRNEQLNFAECEYERKHFAEKTGISMTQGYLLKVDICRHFMHINEEMHMAFPAQ